MAPSSAPTGRLSQPTPTFAEHVSIAIKASVPIGGDGDTSTCPAEVTLSFTPSGGDPTGTGAACLAADADLFAKCTNVGLSVMDAMGTSDGHTATITGKDVTLVFPVGP